MVKEKQARDKSHGFLFLIVEVIALWSLNLVPTNLELTCSHSHDLFQKISPREKRKNKSVLVYLARQFKSKQKKSIFKTWFDNMMILKKNHTIIHSAKSRLNEIVISNSTIIRKITFFFSIFQRDVCHLFAGDCLARFRLAVTTGGNGLSSYSIIWPPPLELRAPGISLGSIS